MNYHFVDKFCEVQFCASNFIRRASDSFTFNNLFRMNQNRDNANGNGQRRRNNDSPNYWAWGAAAAGAVAALAGGIYYLTTETKNSRDEKRNTDSTTGSRNSNSRVMGSNVIPRTSSAVVIPSQTSVASSGPSSNSWISGVTSFLENMTTEYRFHGIPRASVPARPVITNLDSLLEDIYTRFIALKNEDFQEYYSVFMGFFKQLQDAMVDVDPFYARYSSRKQFAGSHFDNLRIVKPDEFDMDIVINLPVNFKENPENLRDSDIYIEAKSPGFVQLRMGTQFLTLYKRDGTDCLINVTAYEWKDSQGYLMRDKFINWFKSVVVKGLNKISSETNGCWKVNVAGRSFRVKMSHGGNSTAVTLFIEDSFGFKLDVDLVPAFKFPMSRWPVSRGYRAAGGGGGGADWMVVPKPNKAAPAHDQPRSWRLALHDHEKKLMHDKVNLKKTIRLMKKLRDALGLHKIYSYYIKTLFFWEIDAGKDPKFWSQNSPTALFKIMVPKLHAAVVAGEIPYYWNKKNNLIASVAPQVLTEYARKLEKLMSVLNQPTEYRCVAKFLLTEQEHDQYAKFL